MREAEVVALPLDILAPHPDALLELILLQADIGRAVHIAKEPHENVARTAPRLRLIVAEILDAQADLLHDFARDAFLKRFADLREARDERVEAHLTVRVLREQDAVAVDDADDDRRYELRVDDAAAARAAQCPLHLLMLRTRAAAPAEAVVRIPSREMICRVRHIHERMRLAHAAAQLAQRAVAASLPRVDGREREVEIRVVQREEESFFQ